MTYPFLDKRFDSATSAQIALTAEDGSYGDFIHLKYTKSEEVRWYKSCENIKYCYLKYNPGYSFDKILDENGVIVENATVTISPKLSIILSSGERVIGDGLSTDELLWLGEELSDFLSTKLRIIYPTPQLSPPYTE